MNAEFDSLRQELAELREQVAMLVQQQAAGGAADHRAEHLQRRLRHAARAEATTNVEEDGEAPPELHQRIIDDLAASACGEQITAGMLVSLVMGDKTGRWSSVQSQGPIGRDGDVGEAARVFSVLGHETRLRILQLLWDGEKAIQELCEGTNLSTGALYHHLRELDGFRWVKTRQRNAYRITAAGRKALVSAWQFAKFLERAMQEYETAEDPAADDASQVPTVPGAFLAR
jgi:DNA-binding transcriptional ArsR family regulator